MMLTELDRVVRLSGLPVDEVPGWRTRGHGGMTAVDGAVCHHTAGPRSGDFPSRGVLVDGRPGLDGPLCNLGLTRSGRVVLIAAGLAWHAGAVRSTSYVNARRIGIEAEATGLDGVPTDWTDEQVDAYARLCAALAIGYHFDASDVLGHKEVCWPVGRKIDPHPFDMAAHRQRVERYIGVLGGVSRGGTRPTIPAQGGRPVLAKGNRGSAVRQLEVRLTALQWRPGSVEGLFDADVDRAVLGLQVAAGLVPDRVVGPRTWRALDGGQRPRFTVSGLVRPGEVSDDVADVQRALTRVGIPTKVDRDYGPATLRGVKRRQVQLDLDDDGVVGRDTAAALGGIST